MNSVVLSSYQPMYVVLSFFFAVAGSFVALTAAKRIKQPDGSFSTANTLTAGLALGGIGVWAMHFVGMLALKLDVASSYAMVETGLSLVAAILAASLALGYVARAPERVGRMLVAGTLLGMSVVVMHYLGMYGMKIGGYIQWDYAIVAASIAIAVLAATAALWLAFHTADVLRRLGAALGWPWPFAPCTTPAWPPPNLSAPQPTGPPSPRVSAT